MKARWLAVLEHSRFGEPAGPTALGEALAKRLGDKTHRIGQIPLSKTILPSSLKCTHLVQFNLVIAGRELRRSAHKLLSIMTVMGQTQSSRVRHVAHHGDRWPWRQS